MDIPFPPLKLPNKRREEYSKNIPFIPFHSLLPNGALVFHRMTNKSIDLAIMNSLRSKLANKKVEGVFWPVVESLGEWVYEHFSLYIYI